MSDGDEVFMRRAIALAAEQVGRTAENPAVGCVLVRDGAIVGEGATADGGRPHAEEIALAAAGENARDAIAFVTLEPCATRSAGGVPCADRLIAAGVARVVFAVDDPHPNAAGQGPDRLTAAGIPVERGLLRAEAAPLVADFLDRWRR